MSYFTQLRRRQIDNPFGYPGTMMTKYPSERYTAAALAGVAGLAAAGGIARAVAKKKAANARNAKSRKMSAAPLTVGMQIKRPPVRVSESGNYDSKTVSACEVLFSSIVSTDNQFTGGSQDLEMLLNPLHPSLKILADEAKNFQMFRFKACSVVFESTVNSTTNGSVILGQLTDVLDNAPNNYEDVALLKDTIQSNVWQSCSLPLHLDNMFRYVSYGTSSVTDAEIRQVNQAKLFFSLINTAIASGAVGNIKLEYTCELSKRVNGDPLNIFDRYSYLLTPGPTALESLTPVVNVRRTPWFERDGTNLILKPRGTYIMNFTLIINADEDADAPGQTVLPYDLNGNSITPILNQQYVAYTDTTYTNTNVYTTLMRFNTQNTDSYIDFTALTTITGAMNIALTIDLVN